MRAENYKTFFIYFIFIEKQMVQKHEMFFTLGKNQIVKPVFKPDNLRLFKRHTTQNNHLNNKSSVKMQISNVSGKLAPNK